MYDDPSEIWGGPNKDLSLTEARKNYRKFGACSKDMLEHVRAPKRKELPENN